ncbi:MAG: tRNA preQ1(34) S-adenosylmethionine ribosyltransferase-isomerase QueA [Clostridiales bacterium]|nr:tRNA preQ1(34) S-adenosylmethionine ribosyltransferase-isomerase QueA [Clostridiales bacterium]
MEYTKKSTYNYYLPEELIAQYPAEPRDSARLLVYDKKTKKIEHKLFSDILDYLTPNDVLVLNNSRVLPARIYGEKVGTGAKIEALLQKRLNLTDWEIIAKPLKRLKPGTIVKFSDELSFEFLELLTDGVCKVRFIFDGRFEEILDRIGSMPLPPYITKKLENNEDYQTVYSKEQGSSAAPTAGLHWTNELLQKAKDKGVEVLEVMLHVGLGTFRPVKEDDILNHEMHSEYFEVTEEVAQKINEAKKQGKRIIACGTTSVRVLESAAVKKGEIKAQKGDTKIFIYPPYDFKIVNALITNFHLPESTLLMLVSALESVEEIKQIYQVAVDQKYRFFSFGDAMLLL